MTWFLVFLLIELYVYDGSEASDGFYLTACNQITRCSALMVARG